MAVTLASLIEQIRERADMQNSNFVTDSELTTYVNNSYFELYDVLESRFEDYFLYVDPGTGLPPQFTLPGGPTGSTFDLPADFYKLRGIDLLFDGVLDSWLTLRKWNFAERSYLQNNNLVMAWGRPQPQYRIMGSKVYMLPYGQAQGVYRLWYVPKCAALSDVVDMIPYMEQWSDYIVVDCAIKCQTKEESDPSVFVLQKQQLVARIEALASNRDVGEPERIADVNRGSYGSGGWGPWGGGGWL